MIGIREDPGGGIPVQNLAPLVRGIFAPDGHLTSALGLEFRPQQQQMAQAVAAAFDADRPLLFEAGTGVGKSLAYLAPAIIHSMETKRPCVVSTHTISLQEQIDQKDLPLCRHLFSQIEPLRKYAEFQSAVLVGKANYLCPTRLAQAIASKSELFPSADQDDLQRIVDWSYQTETGLLQELSPPPSREVWDWVNADGSACNRKNCSPEHCFYQKARARMRRAQVVIVNHSLLFALVNAGGLMPGARGILLPDDFVVLDEAHTVPEVATDHFGLRLSSFGLDRQLKILFNPKRKTGLLKRHGSERDRKRVVEAVEAAGQFFGVIRERLLQKQPIVRIREPDWCEPTILPPLRAVIDAVAYIHNQLPDGSLRDDFQDHKGRLGTYYDGIKRFLSLAEEDHVHWLERSGKSGQIVTFRTAPIDVAPYLRESVFQRQTSVVLTSATLAVAGHIEPYQIKTGATGEKSTIVASPFDFDRNMRVYIAADIPLPSPREARLALTQLTDYIGFCATRVEGGTLVLFTSYFDMRKAADALEPLFRREGRPFFMQGRHHSRTELTGQFRSAGNGVLFGTDSFWTGVDVPGPALSQVIITRLPFDVPTHPIAEAKSEWIRSHGGNPFAELNLPDALTRFRQGIGRLIRQKEDRGIVTILDPRILVKTYGRQFLDSLPTERYERLTRDSRESVFREPR